MKLIAYAGLAVCGASACADSGNARPGREILEWSDEFNAASAQPDPGNWTYDRGADGWGNQELETYCAWASAVPPCDAAAPNAYVGGGYLHIVTRAAGNGVFTSARLKTEGLRSFQYGRIEARIRVPAGQGIWPAFWMLGDSIAAVSWPACGELDIMENIGGEPATIHGSIHAPGLNRGNPYTLANGAKFSGAFHVYGLIWSPAKVQYYIDDPAHVYATFTPAAVPSGGKWPFDQGKFFFVLNVAVGGNWPGSPDAATSFPQEMLIDYVRVYSAPPPSIR